MKRIFMIVAAAMVGAAFTTLSYSQTGKRAGAAPKTGTSEITIKSGSCAVKQRKNFSEDTFKVEVGKIVKGTCSFYIDDFFDKKIINANIEVTNTAKRPMFCQYYVAFFDKDGRLVGCAGQGFTGDEGLKPGQATQLGSCLIPLPPGTHEQVASYQVAFYESDVEVGK